MIMMMVVIVMMAMIMVMIMTMRMIVMMDALMRAAAARILAEHERFDRDRHGIGRHADAAEIDIVEIPQHDAVDDEKIALDVKLVAKEMPERVRYVAVQHDVERQLLGDALANPRVMPSAKAASRW